MYRSLALCLIAVAVLIPTTPPLAPFASPVIPTMQAPPRHAPTTTIGDALTTAETETTGAKNALVETTVPTLVHTPQPQPTRAPVATRTPRRVDAGLWRRWERMQEP